MAIAMMLHPAQDIGWLNWTVHPSTAIGLAALGAVYEWRARQGAPLASSGGAAAAPAAARDADAPRSPTVGQRASFFAGLFVIFAALNGPLHDLSDYYLFSGHMVQHLLLTLLVPPLLLAGTPGWMLRPALRWPVVGPLARLVTRPGSCFLLFNLVVTAWHIPGLYNLAMRYHEVHIAQHVMFMVTAVIMWWPYLSPLPELPRLAYPGQMLYSFLMSLPMSVTAIYIAMADRVLYPAYASAPRLWGITPLMDQHIGGLIMWVPGGLFFYLVMTVVFFKWVAADDDTRAGAQVGFRPSVAGD